MSTETKDTARADIRGAILLKWMLDGHKTLTPEIRDGRVTYPEATGLIPGGDPVEILDQLAARGILKKERHASEVLCPSCGSSALKDQYTCTFCRGAHLETGEMIEHYACGNVDFEAKFYKDGKLICPKCGKELKVIGTDYRRVGKVFRCNDCGKDSSIPRIVHICQNCGTASTWEQTQLRALYKYRINEDKMEEIKALTGVYIPLVEFLQKQGFKTESPAFIEGESGTKHSFDIVAFAAGKRTVFDIVTAKEAVDETAVIAFFAKALDVAHEECILICLPRASDRARTLSKLYNIGLIEGSNVSEVIGSLAALFMKKPVAPGVPARHVVPQHEPIRPTELDQLRSKIALAEFQAKTALVGGATAEPEEKASPMDQLRSMRDMISALQSETEQIAEKKPTSGEAEPTEESKGYKSSTTPMNETAVLQMDVEDEKLRILEQLRLAGKIGEEEYLANKRRILKAIAATHRAG